MTEEEMRKYILNTQGKFQPFVGLRMVQTNRLSLMKIFTWVNSHEEEALEVALGQLSVQHG
jgi:hypothetical protein